MQWFIYLAFAVNCEIIVEVDISEISYPYEEITQQVISYTTDEYW